ncbi:hypothetical protein KHA80_12725 [Anaerobacillus sp. HL2]|nr:hypothetical protein KHA80_12725 [Anaerobacillus sp. HL2]
MTEALGLRITLGSQNRRVTIYVDIENATSETEQ